jgi:hypothetical protein
MCERRKKHRTNSHQRRNPTIIKERGLKYDGNRTLLYIEDSILRKLIPKHLWDNEMGDFNIKCEINNEYGYFLYNLQTKEYKIWDINREEIEIDQLRKFINFTKKFF